jgi:uncharacterized membrane protein YkvA (DUF1232 family)
MQFDKQKALEVAKNLADKFNPEDVGKFIEKHKDLEFIEDVKILFSMAVDSIKGNYKIDKKTFLIIAGALVYTALPTDVIPDFIPGIGFLDDAFVIGYTIKSIKDEVENYKRFKGEETKQIK